MKVALAVVRTVGEYDSTMDCDYAVIDLSCPERFKKLLSQAALLKTKVGSLRGFEVWDCTPDIISLDAASEIFGETIVEEADSAHDGNAAFVFEASDDQLSQVANASERVEGSIMHVSETDVYWSFYPRHTSVSCETNEIVKAMLD